jgi:site-specific recombinase XerD
LVHIATCRGNDGLYLAFLVKQDNIAKALSNPSPVSSEPKTTRSAAMLSLLEATEQRIAEALIRSNSMRENGKKSSVAPPEPKVVRVPLAENASIDYGEKPKDKGFMPWRKSSRMESAYARNM